MIQRLFVFWIIPGILAVTFACTAQSRSAAPATTVASAPTATPVPTPTAVPVVDNCAKCHSDKATLEKLAPKETAQSAETAGEG